MFGMEFLVGLLASLIANGLAKVTLPKPLLSSEMPLVTLANGLVVGNFSSSHSFTFTDGSVLPACSAERSTLSALQVDEKNVSPRKQRWSDIAINFSMSEQVRYALHEASKVECDIIIVPLPVLQSLKLSGRDVRKTKFRTIRMADRVKKIAFADKFCV